MNINAVNLIMSLMNNLDIPPLEVVWSAGKVHNQDGVAEVNEGE